MEEDETPMATVLSGGTRSTHQQQQQQQQQAVDGGGQGRRERRANRQAAHLHQREREFTGKNTAAKSWQKKSRPVWQNNRPLEEKLAVMTIIFYHLTFKHLLPGYRVHR